MRKILILVLILIAWAPASESNIYAGFIYYWHWQKFNRQCKWQITFLKQENL